MHRQFALQCQSPVMPRIVFRLKSGVFILGRSSKSDFVVTDPTISRHHATISVTKDSVTIRDMGSRNGSYINDRRVAQGDVVGRDRIRFGEVPFLLVAWTPDESDSETDTKPGGKPQPVHAPHFEVEAMLSEAQKRVFALVLEGLSEKKIASRLQSSQRTIHNHIQAIYRTLNVHSRSELLAAVIKTTTLSATASLESLDAR
jgi:DNA-binding CsgD family transcriptional regulator